MDAGAAITGSHNGMTMESGLTLAAASAATARHREIAATRRASVLSLAPVRRLVAAGQLCFAQRSLIFPGQRKQGQPCAHVIPPADSQLIQLRATTGERLTAMHGPALDADGNLLSDAHRRPTILFFYGNDMCLGDMAYPFDELRRAGANVLIPDYVGFGLSDGRPSERGCYAAADAALAYLRQRVNGSRTPIVVAGASLGGAVAIDLASRAPGVDGLFTIITFSSIADVARLHFKAMPTKLIRHRFESERKMARVTCPALLAHSTGDELIPYAMCDRLAAACAGPVTRLRIDGAGHRTSEILAAGEHLIRRAVGEFLESLPASAH